MAENKKGFILYANWWFWLEDLTPLQKAEWVDWLFNYVNDKKPEMPKDQALKIVCKMTKAQLKEDLEKWQDIREKRIEAGKKGGLATQSKNKQNQANALIDKSNQAVNDNVNVNVNVNDNVCVDTHNNNACACEETAINNLQELIKNIETLYSRCLTMKELAQVELLSKKYDPQRIYSEIKNNIDKDFPISYICKTLSNISKYEDKRKQFEEEIEEDEWMQGFYERQRQEEEQRKKELRNED